MFEQDQIDIPLPAPKQPCPDGSLLWFIRLRWCAALAQGLFVLLAVSLLGFRFQLPPLAAAVALLALSNLLLLRRFNSSGALPRRWLQSALLADSILLTVLLYLTGGAANPFGIIYLVYIIIAAIVLDERWTWIMTGQSILMYGLLFNAMGSGEHAAHMQSAGFAGHLEGMWLAFAFTAVLIAFFVNRILSSLRRRDEEAAELRLHAARSEQFAALVNLAAGAAHELGTPLGTIAVAANELKRGFETCRSTGEQQADAVLIAAEVDRCKRILEAMGGQGGTLRGEMPSRFSLAQLRSDLASQAAELGIAAEGWLPSPDNNELNLPRGLLAKSLLNLIKNSADADPGGHIKVEANFGSGTVEFKVADTGSGIPKELLPRLGEPFLTTKAPGRGMGLGVFLVKVFAERLGGELRYQPAAAGGTIARLSLPLNWTGR